MKLLWGLFNVPTHYAIYIVVDKENSVLKFVKEFDTKGHAVKWVATSGDKDLTYCLQTHLRRR